MEAPQPVESEAIQISDATLSIKDERTAIWLYKGDPRRPHKETKGQTGRLESLRVRLGMLDKKTKRSICSKLFKSRERCPLISPLVTPERSISQSGHRSAKRWLADIMANSEEDSRNDMSTSLQKSPVKSISQKSHRSAEEWLKDIMATSEEDYRDERSNCLQSSPPRPSLSQIQPAFRSQKVAVEEIEEKILKPVKMHDWLVEEAVVYGSEHESHSEDEKPFVREAPKELTLEERAAKAKAAVAEYEAMLAKRAPEKKGERFVSPEAIRERSHTPTMSEYVNEGFEAEAMQDEYHMARVVKYWREEWAMRCGPNRDEAYVKRLMRIPGVKLTSTQRSQDCREALRTKQWRRDREDLRLAKLVDLKEKDITRKNVSRANETLGEEMARQKSDRMRAWRNYEKKKTAAGITLKPKMTPEERKQAKKECEQRRRDQKAGKVPNFVLEDD